MASSFSAELAQAGLAALHSAAPRATNTTLRVRI
jgi:hypothetical protein